MLFLTTVVMGLGLAIGAGGELGPEILQPARVAATICAVVVTDAGQLLTTFATGLVLALAPLFGGALVVEVFVVEPDVLVCETAAQSAT